MCAFFKKFCEIFDSTTIYSSPLTTKVLHHIETSQLICNANQLTGFYIMGGTGC